MEISDILSRKFYNASGQSPLRLMELDCEDLAQHKALLKPLLRELTKSYNVQAMLMCACWERFERMFSCN